MNTPGLRLRPGPERPDDRPTRAPAEPHCLPVPADATGKEVVHWKVDPATLVSFAAIRRNHSLTRVP